MPPAGPSSGTPRTWGVKDITLELGGKNALIAFPDADPAQVAAGAVAGMNFVRSSGQSCGSTSRLLLHESIADEVLARVIAQMEAIRVGSPLDPATEMGTMATRGQHDKALGFLAGARDEGAGLLAGGGRPAALAGQPGLFVAPTLLGGVASGHADRPRGGLRAGAIGDHLEGRRRCGRDRQQCRFRARRKRMDRRYQPGARGGRRLAGRGCGT
jgi:hypothetical protein